MKLYCDVIFHDDELCYSTKMQRSVLLLGKKVDSYKTEAYLVWKTKKRKQVKYLISTKDLYVFTENLKNISKVGSWVLTERFGSYKKSSYLNSYLEISFKNPPHTLKITCFDKYYLRKFKDLVEVLHSRSWYLFHNKLFNMFDCKLRYTANTDGSKLRNLKEINRFPGKILRLNLNYSNIAKLDLQCIHNLYSLRILNLSNNQILFLPKELGILPHLERLFLFNNCLGNTCLEIPKWEWMEQTAISQSLKELDISNNNLTELPLQIGKLQSLICLNVSNNLLRKVPQIIGTLQQLAWLNLRKNKLSYLPGSMRGMELWKLCAYDNPFRDLRDNEYRSPTPKVVSLFDLAAKATKKHRIPYNNLPSKLARYLDNSKYCCICRNFCFHSDMKSFELLLDNIHRFSDVNFVFDVCQDNEISERPILFKCYFCSLKCYVYYCNTH